MSSTTARVTAVDPYGLHAKFAIDTTEDWVIEYVDHLHDHFLDPVVIRGGHHTAPTTAPTTPGSSAAKRPESIAEFTFPGGAFRAADLADTGIDAQKRQAA
ncbi:hypothetical protein SGFS_024610 [Streptomyces graminofaciens]|uniref:Uncharacterized protein n=1 Tax=Streptomyces graminofaciens TaxID=68212 RepID=A0ABM7F5J6_9ACTN|nr:hypothetical protein SGFS_024610 [Streptomyces graminofaciens]